MGLLRLVPSEIWINLVSLLLVTVNPKEELGSGASFTSLCVDLRAGLVGAPSWEQVDGMAITSKEQWAHWQRTGIAQLLVLSNFTRLQPLLHLDIWTCSKWPLHGA